MRAADTTGHEPAERAEPAEPAELLRGEPAVRRWARAVRWYVRSMMGDDAYDRYRAHCLSAHPDGANHGGSAPMTEREFWRDRTDRQDAQPQGRCC
jgi:uncharacterized short protein YbdD (DUF466 family)